MITSDHILFLPKKNPFFVRSSLIIEISVIIFTITVTLPHQDGAIVIPRWIKHRWNYFVSLIPYHLLSKIVWCMPRSKNIFEVGCCSSSTKTFFYDIRHDQLAANSIDMPLWQWKLYANAYIILFLFRESVRGVAKLKIFPPLFRALLNLWTTLYSIWEFRIIFFATYYFRLAFSQIIIYYHRKHPFSECFFRSFISMRNANK